MADVRWIGKRPTRLPEATLLMMPLAPCAGGSGQKGSAPWEVEKLGSWVDTTHVVPSGGAAHLHAVGDGGARRTCAGARGSTTV